MWWKSLASIARARHRPDHAISQIEEVPLGKQLVITPPIYIVAIGCEPPAYDLLGPLASSLARTFQVPCLIDERQMDASFAFNAEREQYYSTALLEKLTNCGAWLDSRVLGVTSLDLYVPILTFVFGEAQLEGHCAVVSYNRLPEPDRPELLLPRLIKEATHEIGHTFGLRHCHDWNCVMTSSHSVERLDIKSEVFCSSCWKLVKSAAPLNSAGAPPCS